MLTGFQLQMLGEAPDHTQTTSYKHRPVAIQLTKQYHVAGRFGRS